ncbi:dephospho-CoA kinase [bacterium]|nr:dephospho-CoA kinase [bacterium]
MSDKNTIIAGITGGTGTGKSLFCKFLQDLGAAVIDVDNFAKQLMNKSDSIRNSLRSEFGDKIFDLSGKINSKHLSEIVLKGNENFKKLNKIVWPELICNLKTSVENFRENGKGLLVVDMAVLFEAKAADLFDLIIVIDSPIRTRIHRLRKYKGWPEDRISAIISAQTEQTAKLEAADYSVTNNGSSDALKKQANEIFIKLMNDIK